MTRDNWISIIGIILTPIWAFAAVFLQVWLEKRRAQATAEAEANQRKRIYWVRWVHRASLLLSLLVILINAFFLWKELANPGPLTRWVIFSIALFIGVILFQILLILLSEALLSYGSIIRSIISLIEELVHAQGAAMVSLFKHEKPKEKKRHAKDA